MTAAAAESPSSMERLVFFSDAVFAIVITLLVLPLTGEIELPAEGQDLRHEVVEQWPKVVSFVVSFLVIGQFWIAHHNMFSLLRRWDPGLLWLNLVVLLTVSFMPFPTAVLGARLEDSDRFPVVFYAASMTVSSIAMTLTWWYALRRHLVDPELPSAAVHQFTARAFVTSAMFLLSVVAAGFLGLAVAVAFWLVLLPAGRIIVVRALSRP